MFELLLKGEGSIDRQLKIMTITADTNFMHAYCRRWMHSAYVVSACIFVRGEITVHCKKYPSEITGKAWN